MSTEGTDDRTPLVKGADPEFKSLLAEETLDYMGERLEEERGHLDVLNNLIQETERELETWKGVRASVLVLVRAHEAQLDAKRRELGLDSPPS